jgi:hypothetical protein
MPHVEGPRRRNEAVLIERNFAQQLKLRQHCQVKT